MNLVLYVEQRSDMTQKVVDLFTSNGHRLIVVKSNGEACDYCKKRTPDIVFLRDYPERYSCTTYAKMIKRQNCDIYVILVGEKIIAEQVVNGLNGFANQYISQECGAEGILAYAQAIEREDRLNARRGGVLKVAKDVYLKRNVSELIVGRSATRLTVKQYAILRLLVENCSCVVRRRSLLLEGWGCDDESNVQGLRKIISCCRKLLKPIPYVEIVTYWQMGYMLKVQDEEEANVFDENEYQYECIK